jgi:hypothetical protein
LRFRRGKKNICRKSLEDALPKNQAAEPGRAPEFRDARTMLRARSIKGALFAALAGLLSSPATAGEIPYAVALGSNEQLSGVVSVDDSSGEVTSAKGAASGAVSGDYVLDASSADATLHSATSRLDVHLDRKSQQLRARLDSCAVSLENCSSGNWVTLWEQ